MNEPHVNDIGPPTVLRLLVAILMLAGTVSAAAAADGSPEIVSANTVFNADGSEALVGFQDGAMELWRMDTTLDELMAWTEANRYIPELTCEQRLLFDVGPLCEPEE